MPESRRPMRSEPRFVERVYEPRIWRARLLILSSLPYVDGATKHIIVHRLITGLTDIGEIRVTDLTKG